MAFFFIFSITDDSDKFESNFAGFPGSGGERLLAFHQFFSAIVNFFFLKPRLNRASSSWFLNWELSGTCCL